MPRTDRPTWQLPPGVTRGAWDYVHAPHIAEQYDEYFLDCPLFETDEAVLRRHFQPAGVVADLGSGTGRALLPLLRAGHRGLAVDLSAHMLEIVRQKAAEEQLPVDCVQANLCQLDCLADGSVDYAMCLFSTLGMIRGRLYRRFALGHFHRIIKPGGKLVLHVHNLWYNARDPQGPFWLIRNLLTAPFTRDVEVGDKWFPYRGLPSMFLHVFRWGELKADLHLTCFRIVERIALDAPRREPLRYPWLLGPLRTNGWIVVCEA